MSPTRMAASTWAQNGTDVIHSALRSFKPPASVCTAARATAANRGQDWVQEGVQQIAGEPFAKNSLFRLRPAKHPLQDGEDQSVRHQPHQGFQPLRAK